MHRDNNNNNNQEDEDSQMAYRCVDQVCNIIDRPLSDSERFILHDYVFSMLYVFEEDISLSYVVDHLLENFEVILKE